MNRLRPRLLLSLIAALGLPATAALSQGPQLPLCRVNQLRLATDDQGGNFNGMSHSGTLLIVRNLGPDACAIQPIAHVTLMDSAGKDLGAKGILPGARFLHPGPVVLPIALPAGAEATATLRWVSGPVFEKNTCISSKHVNVSFGGNPALKATLIGTLCGDAAKGVTFDQSRFVTSPVYPTSGTGAPGTR